MGKLAASNASESGANASTGGLTHRGGLGSIGNSTVEETLRHEMGMQREIAARLRMEVRQQPGLGSAWPRGSLTSYSRLFANYVEHVKTLLGWSLCSVRILKLFKVLRLHAT